MKDRRKKLTDDQVKEIQRLFRWRIPSTQIARHYEISVGTVRHHTASGQMPQLSLDQINMRIAA